MKGIVLCAGSGSRLGPISNGLDFDCKGISKGLVDVYDKPSIYYPISNMIDAGITDILIIAAPDNVDDYRRVLGDGSGLNVNFSYDVQEKPRGIAEAFVIGSDFIGDDDVALMFGDNIFNGNRFIEAMKKARQSVRGALVFAYRVGLKEAKNFGVVEFDARGRAISLEEKPETPKSPFAVPGAYFYTSKVVELAKTLQPSARGELEVTDLNRLFLEENLLDVVTLDTDTDWHDTGTARSLRRAINAVADWQDDHDDVLGSPELAAWRTGRIDTEQLLKLADRSHKSEYGQKLREIATRV